MSKTVYVGRIPFEMTEEQLEDIFRSTGPVQQTRLMFDRATGKSKGFAFVHYFDPESAASAVRNLDNYKVGNLRLKVNYSSGSFQGQSSGGGGSGGGAQHQNQSSGGGRGQREEPQESGAIQDIVNTVSNLQQSEKTELLNELTQLVTNHSDEALKLLDENPQLAYAIVQTLFEVGAVDGAKAVSLIVEQPGATPGPVSREPTPAAAPAPRRAERKRAPPARAPAAPLHAQPHAPPSQPSSRPPSQQSTPQPAQQPDPSPMETEQKQMIRQILALTPEQLEAMPADQRNAALTIRQQVQTGAVVL